MKYINHKVSGSNPLVSVTDAMLNAASLKLKCFRSSGVQSVWLLVLHLERLSADLGHFGVVKTQKRHDLDLIKM